MDKFKIEGNKMVSFDPCLQCYLPYAPASVLMPPPPLAEQEVKPFVCATAEEAARFESSVLRMVGLPPQGLTGMNATTVVDGTIGELTKRCVNSTRIERCNPILSSWF